MKTLFLSEKKVKSILTMDDTLKAVEMAFRAKGQGNIQLPPKMYLYYETHNGDLRVMPSYIPSLDISGVKVVNVHPNNPKKYKLPSVMATILLVNPANGYPIGVLDGTWITTMRTGAASGVASKYLARPDASVLALVGAGAQAETQLEAILKVRKIKKVKLYDIVRQISERFVKKYKHLKLDFKICNTVKECVKDADIICTVTPVRKPIVKAAWVKKGAHINAMGADAPGKEELEPLLVKRSKIIIDDWDQASHSGEINVPLAKGIISKKDIFAEIGDVVTGKKKGRTSPNDITIFDSTGLGVQDLTTANIVYNIAKKKKLGTWFQMI
jgi:alanine dehydrogenase